MKKILILLLFLPFIEVDAFYCSYEEQANLQELASNITYRYDYFETEDNITYNIHLTNLTDDVYFVDKTTGQRYDYTDGSITLSGYKKNEIINYSFFVSKGDCVDKAVYSIVFKLPSYNHFYDDELCNGIGEFYLCNRFTHHDFTYKQFSEAVNDYMDSLIIEPEEEEGITKEDGLLDFILRYLEEYYYIPLILIILLSSAKIYRENKRNNIYK